MRQGHEKFLSIMLEKVLAI